MQQAQDFVFNNGKQSYATTSSDVRQIIISQAEPQAARQACQLDRRHREICQQRLTAKNKSRICLDSTGAAQECDLIPMFSQRQFLELIPKNILIYAEDPVHNTFEFYPQGYKLATEGFSVALRKAKLMNTICAIVRPNFLFMESTLQLDIPAYLDAVLLDTLKKEYSTTYEHSLKKPFYIIIRLYNFNSSEYLNILISYYELKNLQEPTMMLASFNVDKLSTSSNELFFEAVKQDKYLERFVENAQYQRNTVVPHRYSFNFEGDTLNVFHLSRFIKIALDQGYYYNCKLDIRSFGTDTKIIL